MSMTIGFDLDGTLDHPALAELAKSLIGSGHDVHIITGCFPEAGEWQGHEAKQEKLDLLGIPFSISQDTIEPKTATLHILDAVDYKKFPTDYRLRDLGLRKGALCFELGIEIYIDNSEDFCKTVPSMNAGVAVLQVR